MMISLESNNTQLGFSRVSDSILPELFVRNKVEDNIGDHCQDQCRADDISETNGRIVACPAVLMHRDLPFASSPQIAL